MSRNKSTLLITLLSLGFVIILIALVFLTDKIPTSYMAIAIYLLEVFCLVPYMNYVYYKLNDVDMGVKKVLNFIPFVNYTISMGKVIRRLVYVSLVCLLVVLLVGFFPSVLRLFGDSVFLNANETLPILALLIFIISNILIGIGLFPICKDVEDLYKEKFLKTFKSRQKAVSAISAVVLIVKLSRRLLVMFPVFRVIPLLYCAEDARDLAKLGAKFE